MSRHIVTASRHVITSRHLVTASRHHVTGSCHGVTSHPHTLCSCVSVLLTDSTKPKLRSAQVREICLSRRNEICWRKIRDFFLSFSNYSQKLRSLLSSEDLGRILANSKLGDRNGRSDFFLFFFATTRVLHIPAVPCGAAIYLTLCVRICLSSIFLLVEAVLSWLPNNPGRVFSQAFHFHPLAGQLGLSCVKLRAQKRPVMG